MKAVIQRVSRASVSVEGEITGQIKAGLAVLLGVVTGDTTEQADLLVKKILDLRIFTDENGKMNLSLGDIKGELLVISQFTLAADCSHGRRPSFIGAAAAQEAESLYGYFVDKASKMLPDPVQTGRFGAHMEFELVNDGPVTILLDTKELTKARR